MFQNLEKAILPIQIMHLVKLNTQPIGIFALTDEIDKKFTFISLEVSSRFIEL